MRSRTLLFLILAVLLGASLAGPARAPLASAAPALAAQDAVQYVSVNGIRVIKVDLHNPRIRVRAIQANDGGGVEAVASMAQRWGAIAAINGDYFNQLGTPFAEGLLYTDGSEHTHCAATFDCAHWRSSIAFGRDNHPAIGRDRGGRDLYNVVSAGPQFMADGQFRWNHTVQGSCATGGQGQVVINDEVFGCSAAGWNAPMALSAVGYSADAGTLYLAASEGASSSSMQQMHDVLWQQGARNAMRLDSGGSRSLYYNGAGGTWAIGGGRAVVDAIAIVPAEDVPASPCTPSAEQIALFSAPNFGGVCKALGIGDYAEPGVFAPVGNDDTRSIKVGANVRALLYQNGGFDPAPPTVVAGDVADLSATAVGYNTSSLRVQSRTDPPQPPALAAPANGTTIPAGSSVGLAWMASGDDYYGELWGGPGGMQPFGWQAGTNVALPALAPAVYSWHVKARNRAGESGWSDTWSFTVATADCAPGQLHAEYFNNRDLSGPPALIGCENTIDHDWGAGSPGNGINADGFTARWRGRFTADTARYGFDLRADDGIRAWVDGAPLLDAWRDQAPTDYHVEIDLTAGEHELVVEYYENSGGALAQVDWAPIGGPAPGGWVADQWQNGSEFTLDPLVAHGGVRAARISSPVENDARWTQHVAVSSHTWYVLSGWLKTEQVREDRVGANLGLADDWTHSVDLRGTQDWTYVQVAIDSGDRTDLLVGARLGHWNNTTTGTAWFDDLALQAIMPGCLGPNLLQQSGFE